MESFEDRESEITVTDIASLGDLLIDVADPLIKRLSRETAREAVRIMGTSQELKKLPKILKQKKVKTALELLVSPTLQLGCYKQHTQPIKTQVNHFFI